MFLPNSCSVKMTSFLVNSPPERPDVGRVAARAAISVAGAVYVCDAVIVINELLHTPRHGKHSHQKAMLRIRPPSTGNQTPASYRYTNKRTRESTLKALVYQNDRV